MAQQTEETSEMLIAGMRKGIGFNCCLSLLI